MTRILKTYSEVKPFLPAIVDLADANSRELGFLPNGAYEELALKNQIWALVEKSGSDISAFLIFGGSRSALKVIQLFVHPNARRGGAGSTLISALKEYANKTGRQVIAARVACDLIANGFWERQGFYVVQQVSGGRSTGRKINVRVFDVPASSLFSTAALQSASDWLSARTPLTVPVVPTYALDLNVFFDVVQKRPDKDFIALIFASSFSGEVRLCVSSELAIEIARAAKQPGADPLLLLAESLPVVQESEADLNSGLVEELRQIVFPNRSRDGKSAANDTSDLKHLASCISARVSGFVTRDLAVIGVSAKLQERFGLEVLSPQDVVSLTSLTRNWEYQPTRVNVGIQVAIRSYRETDLTSVRGILEELQVNEADCSDFFLPNTSAVRRSRLVAYIGVTLVGFASYCVSVHSNSAVRGLVLVLEGVTNSQLVVDALLGSLMSELPSDRLSRVDLCTSQSQLLTRDMARRLGYSANVADRASLIHQQKWAYAGVVTPREWPRFSEQLHHATGTAFAREIPDYADAQSTGILLSREGLSSKRSLGLIALESMLTPLVLLTPGRPAAIVPIREQLASELLPEVRKQSPLFEREAAIHIERAYFSRGEMHHFIGPGSVVVFYISKAGGGRGEAVGLARVTSSGNSDGQSLHTDLLRQGVLDLPDLVSSSRGQRKICYFTFDRFAKFPSGIPFQVLKSRAVVGKANLITAQALDYAKILEIAEVAWPSRICNG